MNKKSIEAYYSGTVQGVGFRWTVSRLSARFSVGGYVKNLRDGRVLVRVEGAALDVDNFLVAIKQSSLSGYIRDVEINKTEAEGLSSFSIAY